jgi:hypothetical protein
MQELKTELCKIFHSHYSDKCPQIAHSYSPEYFELVKHKKETSLNVLEVGIGNNELMKPLYGDDYKLGASLRAWKDFFSNANIYGIDIRKDVLFSEDRIKCYYTDQSKADALLKTISEIRQAQNNDSLKFDLIIDDGSHIVEHMLLTFKTLSDFVSDNGLYIIEDIKRKDLEVFTNLQKQNFEIVKVHKGNTYWDDFVAFQKTK